MFGLPAITVAVVGFIASVITIVAVFPDIRGWLRRKVAPLALSEWKDVPKEIERATSRVLILQTWVPGFRIERPFWRKAAANENVDFRVLLLDPKLVPFRLRCRELESSLITQNVVDLGDFVRNLAPNRKFEARFYSCLPFGPVYVVDETVYWGIYLADQDSLLGPAFRCDASSKLGKQIISSFESVWRSGATRMGSLVLPGPSSPPPIPLPRQSAAINSKVIELGNLLRRVRDAEGEPTPETGALFLLRHAETDLNQLGVFTGELDIGINRTGLQSATEIRAGLGRQHFHRILSSPLRRCVDTFREILGERVADIELRDELRERSMGDVEGYCKDSYADSLSRYRGVDLENGFFTKAEGGESFADVLWRSIPILEEILPFVQRGNRILLCSHESVLRVFRLVLESVELEEFSELSISNGEFLQYRPR